MLLADAGSVHTERFLKELKRQGCHVLTASLESGSMRYVHLKRLGPVKSFHYLLAVPQVKSIIKRFRPEVINAHYACGYGFIAARASGEGDAPIVLNLWGSDVLIIPGQSSQGRMKTKMALESADWVIGDSEYLVEGARKIVTLKNQRVIPWGIECQFLKLHRNSYTLGDPLRIIVPRRHEEVYNNGFIVQALESLIKEGEVQLTFPDFGALAGDFKKQVARLPESGVNLYSLRGRGEFLSLMAEHDVYLSASRSDSSPSSLIEAMALGLIPVAANIPGVREWLTTGSGFTFEPGDMPGLRELVVKLRRDGDPLENMRRANYRRCEEKAIFEDNVAEQVELMTKVARGKA